MLETALYFVKLISGRVFVTGSANILLEILSKLRVRNILKWIQSHKPKLYIGVDMGRSQFNYVLIRYTPAKKKNDTPYEVLSTIKYRNKRTLVGPDSEVFEHIINDIKRLIKGANNDLNIKSTRIDGIVFGVPGLVQPDTGVIEQAIDFLGNDRKLAFIDEFSSACRKKKLVLNDKCQQLLDNDGNCVTRYVCSYHSRRMSQGAVKAGNFVCFIVGNNFGAGIAVNNNIFYGDNHKAGEVGHMIIESGIITCSCGKGSGHAEQRISRRGLENLVSTYSSESDSILQATSDRFYTLVRERMQASLSTSGQANSKMDPVVTAVEELTRYLAITIANLVNVLDICHIYFSGAMMRELIFNDNLDLEASLRKLVDEKTFISIRDINFTLVDGIFEKSKGENILDDRFHPAIGAALACEDEKYVEATRA